MRERAIDRFRGKSFREVFLDFADLCKRLPPAARFAVPILSTCVIFAGFVKYGIGASDCSNNMNMLYGRIVDEKVLLGDMIPPSFFLVECYSVVCELRNSVGDRRKPRASWMPSDILRRNIARDTSIGPARRRS